MKTRLFVLSLAPLLVACASNTGQPTLTQEFVYEQADFPSCHASTIVESPDGQLTVAFFGGTRESADDVCIYQCSKSMTDTVWSAAVCVAQDSLHACWNPVLFKVADDSLLLFYKTGPKVIYWRGHAKLSNDGGKSWEPYIDFPEDMFGAIKNKPVRLASGRIISPSSDERTGWTIHFELSDDSGKTWRKVGPVEQEDSIQSIQPTILVHKDGSLEALCRTKNGKVGVTWSKDEGETWSRVQLMDFPNNNSGLDAVTLPDGRFVMVCNPVGKTPGQWGGPRTPLSVMMSSDGVNWSELAVLEADEGEYSYPCIIVGSDGALHIAYTWKRERIRYAKISL